MQTTGVKLGIALLITTAHASSIPAFAQETVRGHLLDVSGIPVQQAKVWASRVDGPPRALPIRYVLSGNGGEFSIHGLGPGKYRIDSSKEEDGYGNTGFAFYSNHRVPTVDLVGAIPPPEITVVVGPKAGVLTGEIFEEGTGEPLAGSILLWKRDKPSESMSMSVGPRLRVLVPSGEDLDVELNCDGHESWQLSGVRLAPGASKAITIRLQRKN